jgi:hypothetical protein
MKTKIYPDYSSFCAREDKKLNGVSAQFAKDNPEYENKNATNEACWNCSDCSDCYGCSRCYDCSGCYGCSRCYDCSRCSDCYGKKEKEDPQTSGVPVIPSIHQTILRAVEQPDALDMRDWHTCDTTHCRAGWVVHLAGKPGRELESKTSTLFAAMQIYHKSSPDINVSHVRFFDPNERAMADIKRCAELETAREAIDAAMKAPAPSGDKAPRAKRRETNFMSATKSTIPVFHVYVNDRPYLGESDESADTFPRHTGWTGKSPHGRSRIRLGVILDDPGVKVVGKRNLRSILERILAELDSGMAISKIEIHKHDY